MADHTRGEPGYGPNRVDPHIIGAINITVAPEPWRDSAACRNTKTPETFHPDPGDIDTLIAAKRICRQCPVRTACLQHAVTHREVHGVWGGRTYLERQADASLRAYRKEATA